MEWWAVGGGVVLVLLLELVLDWIAWREGVSDVLGSLFLVLGLGALGL